MPAALIPDILLVFYAFIFGACIGSFANVIIYRLPRGISFVRGTSFCPACRHRIMPLELVPIAGYIFLRGKCRHCKAPVSIRYLLIELLAGCLAVLSLSYGLAAPLFFVIFILLTIIAFIDIDHMIIPDSLVICLALCAAVHAFLFEPSLLSRAAGFFVLSAPMLALSSATALLINKNAFGGGDIKLFAVCGFMLGLKLTVFAGYAAILLGGAMGVYIRYIKKDKQTLHIAFGQYICIGVFAAMLFGESLTDMYLAWLSF